MHCLYCGKEIGAFRLLKDREFCRADHRKKYGSRLGKAIHQMAEPEPPPADVATFVCKMPVQAGNESCSIALWTRPATRSAWSESCDTVLLPAFALNVIPLDDETAPMVEQSVAPAQPVDAQPAEQYVATVATPSRQGAAAPPSQYGPVHAPEPEPVFSFVQSVSVIEPAPCAIPVRFVASLQPLPAISTPHIPSVRPCEPIPAAEPVWSLLETTVAHAIAPEPQSAFVPPAAALQPLADASLTLPLITSDVEPLPLPDAPAVPAIQPEPDFRFVQSVAPLELAEAALASAQLPRFTSEIEPLPLPDAPAAPSLQPEPVASFVVPAASLEVVAAPAVAIQLPRLAAGIEPLPLPDAPAAPSLQPEPVASFVVPAASFELIAAPAAIQLPRFTAEIEPMLLTDDLIEPPALCEAWLRAPAPEPVFAFVQSVSAVRAAAAIALRQPGAEELRTAGPYIPQAPSFRAVPPAEPVMAGVWPHVADIPFEPILSAASVELPRISALRVPAAQPQPTRVVAAPAAEAAEVWVSAQSSEQLVAGIAANAAPLEQLAPAAVVAGPRLAAYANAPAPEALESILTATAADQIKTAPVVRLQPFAVAASEGRGFTAFDAPRLASPAGGFTPAQPAAAAGKVAVMPIPTIRLTKPPQPQPQRLIPSISTPGLVPLEFHAQQLRGKTECKLEWRNVRFTPMPPRFGMRTIWEKTELVSKPLPQKTSVAEVFTMPEAKPKSSKLVAYAVKIAAGIVVLAATWYGASSIKMDRALQVRAGASSSASHSDSVASVVDTVVSRPEAARASKTESQGAFTSVRASIARRAAVQISDNMREGMEAWGAKAKTYPAGWSHNADGYVHTGALALFSPTKSFTDYRMEFFGQIEQKSISWTVRAKDDKNYHAMKFSVIEAGLRPIIAMVHYDVINGKAGRKLQTPLNVMVHNNRPFQVAVNVKGNHFTTSVDGEEVDSFSDDALPTGGIGFFADAGEKARLYWVKVSKNDDWLGHFCAFLSGVDAAPAGAELWAPELPGSPAPTYPDTGHATLAGAWMAVPFARASRKARNAANTWRYQEWNT